MSEMNYFEMKALMTDLSVTGRNLAFHILSYLDFNSLINARMVCKTWFIFLEKER